MTVNYYKDGTTDKLAPSVDKGQSDIGSSYTTEPAVIEPKVEVVNTPEKTVTTTTTYTLKEVPADKDGTVPVGGKVVNYYYVENVDVKEVKKQAPVTVNYYLEGTETKLADSDEQGQKDIGSNYTTEPAVIEPKVETVIEDGNIVTKTTTYELVKVPEDKDGTVPVGGKVVNYYYREVISAVGKPNNAPKVEIPEWNGGVTPLDPPTVEIPELKIPEEPKPQPEPTPEPNPAPTLQPAPTPQRNETPKPPVAEDSGTQEVPNRPVPSNYNPDGNTSPAPSTEVTQLPNTGTESNAALAAFGFVGILSGLSIVLRKKDNE